MSQFAARKPRIVVVEAGCFPPSMKMRKKSANPLLLLLMSALETWEQDLGL
jgi:hypothetical protein